MRTSSLIVLSFLFSSLCAAQQVTFKDHGKVVKSAGPQDWGTATTLTVDDPNAKEKIEFSGYPFQKILDSVYGKSWRSADEILFTCSDGYQPSIPVSVFLSYPAVLANQRKGADFEITNRLHQNEKVKLAPYYLIWDDVKAPAVLSEGESIWPYQLTTVDLVSFNERFPHVAPPTKSSASAKRGFVTFRKYCMACHTINGEGGSHAVELNYPVNVTEYYNSKFLRQWIDKPTSIRFSTQMPALSHSAADRGRQIDDVIAYLKAMKDRKISPSK